EFYSNYKVSRDLIELRNLAQVAELMIHSAMRRHESRGLHYTLDYPDLLPQARDTILTPPTYGD
ncbi:MAG TPA: L-aspartate oxidase, partial [Pseudomonas sp.]|nr:L-aspartate oxidase [Pseudomonas sp.]